MSKNLKWVERCVTKNQLANNETTISIAGL